MSTDIDIHRPAPAPAHITQTAAVEQARAVAEVQAAVTVAKKIPRDMNRAIAEMRDACSRMAVADRAFYTVTNRGHGPSVHLMRELARVWGNIESGVHELSRNDETGMSEIRAFAWDVQTNSRTSRTFQVPHARMVNKQRKQLTDLTDVYLNNQNIGARAVRECIAAVLPRWFTEEAQELCRQTLKRGNGVPLEQRIADMVAGFAKLGVSVERMERKFGRPRADWTEDEVADARVAYTSITRDRFPADELFPAEAVAVPEPATAGPVSGPPAVTVELDKDWPTTAQPADVPTAEGGAA